MSYLDINKNTLTISNPNLEIEWDCKENLKDDLYIEYLYANSSIRAHWICPNGHNYLAIFLINLSKYSSFVISCINCIINGSINFIN